MTNLNKTYHKGRYRSGEWAKHLRPYLKRLGNKRFRKIAVNLEECEIDKLNRYKKKVGRRKIKVKLTLKIHGDSKVSHYKSFRRMKDAHNSVSRPNVIGYQFLNDD